jgi:nitroreductase
MVRSFSPDRVDRSVLDRILRAALRAPTAGNSGGTAWIVLESTTERAVYWEATTDAAWRRRNPQRYEGLQRAPVVLLAYASPDPYLARYAEADKSGSGLDTGVDEWPVPYWFGDAAFGVMVVLLGAVDAGLGACVLGNFRGEGLLAASLDVPAGWRLFCAVLLGRPDGRDSPSASLDRAIPPADERLHHGKW